MSWYHRRYHYISIRAPARGATIKPGHLTWWNGISIRAPARGATEKGIDLISGVDDFNPRSREGSDIFFDMIIISFCNFNPRSREGSDTSGTLHYDWVGDFNPRSREGSDAVKEKYQRDTGEISIRAPARGATPTSLCPHSAQVNFNPRSREGSDVRKWCTCRCMIYFNPRSREGSDRIKTIHRNT